MDGALFRRREVAPVELLLDVEVADDVLLGLERQRRPSLVEVADVDVVLVVLGGGVGGVGGGLVFGLRLGVRAVEESCGGSGVSQLHVAGPVSSHDRTVHAQRSR